MSSFDWKKNVEDSIKDGLIITATTTAIFYALKAANVKPPKSSMETMDIMKLAGGIWGGVLVKDYAFYKKQINEWYNSKILWPLKAIKFTQRQMEIHSKESSTALASYCHYISLCSIVKIPLGLVTFKRAVSSSRLNTWHVRSPPLASVPFSIWSKIPLFTSLMLPWSVLSILDHISIHKTIFVVKNSSNVTLDCSM